MTTKEANTATEQRGARSRRRNGLRRLRGDRMAGLRTRSLCCPSPWGGLKPSAARERHDPVTDARPQHMFRWIHRAPPRLDPGRTETMLRRTGARLNDLIY
jgi:hypothetical protein